MSIRALPSVLIAILALMSFSDAALAADSNSATAPAKPQDTGAVQAGSVPAPSQGVTKTRTKSNNSNDLLAPAPAPAEPANKPGDGNPVKIKTKSNIKND